MNELHINTDGGSRGNPGPAAIGVVFYDSSGTALYRFKKYIGVATNNIAEYRALICALEILSKSKWATENSGNGVVTCRLDSKLVVEQLCGNYKTKQDHISEFVSTIKTIIKEIPLEFKFVHIPREKNKEADRLVNEALNEEAKNHSSSA